MPYKIHAIYLCAILGLGSYIYFQKPKVLTQVQIQTQEKVKVEEKLVYRDRVIETTKPNGEKVKETIHETIASNTKEKDNTKIETDTTLDVKSKYSLEIAWSPIHNGVLHTQPTIETLRVTAGIRLFSSPISATIGMSDKFKTYEIGIRYEF